MCLAKPDKALRFLKKTNNLNFVYYIFIKKLCVKLLGIFLIPILSTKIVSILLNNLSPVNLRIYSFLFSSTD